MGNSRPGESSLVYNPRSVGYIHNMDKEQNIMHLVVMRSYEPKATPGTLFINDTRICHTLELPKDLGCIPEGKYNLHLSYSNRFKCIMPEIMDVPGRTGIRIHWGNFIKDTSGCLLVGYNKSKDTNGISCVYESKPCYSEIMNWLIKANSEQKIDIEFKHWD